MNLQYPLFLLLFFVFQTSAVEFNFPPKSFSDGFTPKEKKVMLDAHNFYRRGKQAADMRKLIWNDKLASDAQRWASKCNARTLFDRKDKRGFAGQNGYSCRNRMAVMEKAMTMWMAAKDGFQPPYSQVVWSRTFAVGCGYSRCAGSEQARLVCNYMPEGHIPNVPEYKKGLPCSKCDAGYGFCDRNLCSISCESSNCRCTVDEGKCKSNGGRYNKGKCFCHCPRGKMGLNCEKSCSDTQNKERCRAVFCRAGSPGFRINEMQCPWTCGLCEQPCGANAKCKNCKVDLLKCSFNGGFFNRYRCLCQCPRGKTGKHCESAGAEVSTIANVGQP